MSRAVSFAFPGVLETPTGGYVYDRRVIAELRANGWAVDPIALGEGFPIPTAATRDQAAALLCSAPSGQPVIVDGLALGVLPDVAHAVASRGPLLALVHHPLAYEAGLSFEQAAAFQDSERRALAAARIVVATSRATARILADNYAVPADALVVAPPGTDRVEPARGSANGAPELLAVGAVVARKGYDVLIAALAELRDLPWHLTIVGALDRDRETVEGLRRDIQGCQLEDRVVIAGAVSDAELERYYSGADIFVLASRFEGYGMAYADAVAYGLPIVGCRAGATAETIPAGAAILVTPDDPASLAAALRRLLEDPAERRRMADGARAASVSLPTWSNSAALIGAAIERCQ